LGEHREKIAFKLLRVEGKKKQVELIVRSIASNFLFPTQIEFKFEFIVTTRRCLPLSNKVKEL
jgi:hypothetical protein